MPKKTKAQLVCLFHATNAENVPDIVRNGLLTPFELMERTGISQDQMRERMHAENGDPYSVYLGNKDGLNFPFAIQDAPVAMIKVCFTKDESSRFLPDDDYVEDFIDIPESSLRKIRGFSRASKIREYLRKPRFWKASLEAGYGIRFEGNISPDHIVGYEIGRLRDRKFVKNASMKK